MQSKRYAAKRCALCLPCAYVPLDPSPCFARLRTVVWNTGDEAQESPRRPGVPIVSQRDC